jgi:branched-chain amino acid transport system ATP-binding protein
VTLLSVDDVHAYYGDHHVLDGVSFDVADDEVVAYLGRNGTGKTTSFKVITGLVTPRSGTVTFEGERIDGRKPHAIARRGISFVTADEKVFPHLTVRENVKLPTLERDVEPEYEFLFDLFPDLRRFEHTRAGNLSGGQQQMVALAQGLAADPDLLLVDEPVQGLAVQFVERVSTLLSELADENLAVMLIEHDIDLAVSVADRVLVLEAGHIVWKGPSEELARNDDIIDRYIGVSGYAEAE